VCDAVFFSVFQLFSDYVLPIHAAFNSGLHYAALYSFTLLRKQQTISFRVGDISENPPPKSKAAKREIEILRKNGLQR
jgi:hypothetical protein